VRHPVRPRERGGARRRPGPARHFRELRRRTPVIDGRRRGGVDGFEGSGGHADTSSNVAAVISFYPPTGLERRSWGGLPALFGKGAPEATLRGASPLTYATSSFPPTLLIHGNKDEVVPEAEATRMYEALNAAGVPVELHMFAGQPHGFDADPKLGRQCAEIMLSFMDRFVLGR
jgi:acetyl esterase/lipase